MPAAKIPENEKARLASLHALNVLDTIEEKEFDALVQTASLVCGVPLSFVSLVDAHRQWFKASVGLPGVKETPRELAFCAHTIHQDDLFEVVDAREDPRFSDNPLVLNDPNIRFYAGATLKLSDGANVGALCVIDNQPHQLNETQRAVLRQLAILASNLLEQRSIRDNEKRLLSEQSIITNMLDQSHDAIMTMSIDGLVTRWNKGAEMLFGYTANEMVGETLEHLMPEGESNKTIPSLLEELKSGLEYNATRISKSGKPVTVSVSLSPYFAEDGKLLGVTKIMRDITARIEHEAVLAEQWQLAHTMIDSQSVATFMIDTEHKVVAWNKACEVLTGTKAADIIGIPEAWRAFYNAPRPCLADLVLDDLRQEAKKHYPKESASTLMQDGWHAEAWFNDLGGKRRYVIFDATPIKNPNGILIGALETLQDITQLKHVEQAFKDEKQSLLSVLEGTKAGIWHWNYDTGEYNFSEIWAKLLGYTEGDSAPSNEEEFLCLVHKDDQVTRQQSVNAHIAGATEIFESEFRMEHREGHWLWVATRGRLMSFKSDGKPEWLHGTYIDITARKKLELDLKQAYHNLDEFTAVASHDLKSPLRGIADLVEWITEDLGDDVQESVKDNLNRVQVRVKRLEALINDLLQYSRSCDSSDDVSLVKPKALVNEMVEMLSIPETFKVQVNCTVEQFYTYDTPLKTILRQFIANAVKHHDKDNGNIAININQQKEFVVFEVKDDGPGIPATAHERVFKLFQSLSKSKDSSGIGLAVSKRLADVHGARIELNSDIGDGTSFRLLWPKKSVRIT